MTVTVMDISATDFWKCENLGVIILLLLTSSICFHFIFIWTLVGGWSVVHFIWIICYLCMSPSWCVCVCMRVQERKKVNGKPNFILYPHQTLQVHEYFSVCMNKTFHYEWQVKFYTPINFCLYFLFLLWSLNNTTERQVLFEEYVCVCVRVYACVVVVVTG